MCLTIWLKRSRRVCARDREGSATYGICCPPEEGPRDPDTFTYVVAVQTKHLEEIPAGMVGVEMIAGLLDSVAHPSDEQRRDPEFLDVFCHHLFRGYLNRRLGGIQHDGQQRGIA